MLEKLADLYDEYFGPPGIPWDGLIAKGHGITENGYDPAYMDLLLQESFVFFDSVGKLSPEFRQKYRDLEQVDARKAMTQTQALLSQAGADIWEAVKNGDWSAAVDFPRTVSFDAFASLAANAANAGYLHFDGVVEAAMRAGKLSPEEAMAHADATMKTFETFVYLEKNGHLDDFKVHPVSGLGVAPLVIAFIAIGAVLVLGLAFCFYQASIGSNAQQKIFKWCDDLNSKPGASQEDLRSCISAAENMATHGNPGLGDMFGDLLKPIGVVIALGAAIWVASLVLPGILARKVVAS